MARTLNLQCSSLIFKYGYLIKKLRWHKIYYRTAIIANKLIFNKYQNYADSIILI